MNERNDLFSRSATRARCMVAAVLATLIFLVSISSVMPAAASTLGGGASASVSAAAARGKWIDISLSRQLLTAYVGSTRVFSTYISSGVARHPTPVGTFHIYLKLKSQRMTGGVGREHYDLPNVPNVMYFAGANAIHGAYWHHNFGHPMSHGCINEPLGAAAWLYNWAPIGTTVVVHW